MEESVSLFSELLKYTPHLTELVIHDIVRAFTPERLRNILVSLRSLQTVTLCELTSNYSRVLSDICPNLKTIVLALVVDESHIDFHAVFSPVDPRPFLQSHSPSITKLVLYQVILDASGTPFPGVVDLQISDYGVSDADTGFTGPLVHLFPNVERVQLLSLQSDQGVITPSFLHSGSLQAATDLRSTCTRWQDTHGTWANGLRHIEVGSLVDLYCLGLRCHVARVKIWFPSDPIGIAHTALADVRPRCLQFSIFRLREIEDVLQLLAAVSQICSLDHLVIDVSPGLFHELSPFWLLIQLRNELLGSYVTHILVHVNDNVDEGVPSINGPSASMCSADIYTRAEELLERLVYGNSTLHRVFLDVKEFGLKALERGSNGDWEGRLEIQEVDARRILAAEDMLLL
ncbi:hypothetical protein ACG7TL_007031 [Trametes sanguinea]